MCIYMSSYFESSIDEVLSAMIDVLVANSNPHYTV